MSSQGNIVIFSDSEDEAEEKSLRIHYQESTECFEVPKEADGRVLFEYITCMDSKVFALIIKKDGFRKLITPNGGYIKEPKGKWQSFKVYAVLKKDTETNTNSCGNLNPAIPHNLDMRVNVEPSTMLTEELQNNHQSDHSSSTSSPPMPKVLVNGKTAYTKAVSTPKQYNNHLNLPSGSTRNNENMQPVTDDGESSSGDESSSDESARSIVAGDEPTYDQLLSAFSIKKIDFLRKNPNHSALRAIFTTKNFKCQSCEKYPDNLNNYVQHILSLYHLQNHLNQVEYDNICKAMSIIEKTSDGYRFLTPQEVDRKRKHSSDDLQDGSKRQKKM